MKKYLFLFVLAALALQAPAQDLAVMTYNIRLDVASDGENAWPNRRDYLAAQVQFYAPDILGVQEARPNQVADMAKAFPAYRYVGVGRDGNNQGESSNIFYNHSRFVVKDSGTFWLSETPGLVSKGWDAAYNRVCTYALFYDKKKKKKLWVFNTHLDHVGEEARTKGLELILSRIAALNTKRLPVVLMGDFNSAPDEPRIRHLATKMADTRQASVQKPFGPQGTFNGFRHNRPVTSLIDYIFISPGKSFRVDKYAVLSDSKNLKYPSDHLPVYVNLTYK